MLYQGNLEKGKLSKTAETTMKSEFLFNREAQGNQSPRSQEKYKDVFTTV